MGEKHLLKVTPKKSSFVLEMNRKTEDTVEEENLKKREIKGQRERETKQKRTGKSFKHFFRLNNPSFVQI